MNLDKHNQKAAIILKELAFEMGDERKISKAEKLIRAVFHALRTRLTVEESLKFIAQLPMYLKAVYVDGWKISGNQHHSRHLKDFINDVYNDWDKGSRNLPDQVFLHNAIKSVFKILRKHISRGEIENVKASMPKELKPLWTERHWKIIE